MKKKLFYLLNTVLIGLLVSIFLLSMFPKLFWLNEHKVNFYKHYLKNRVLASFSNGSSYSYAVNQAAPSVVNISGEVDSQKKAHQLSKPIIKDWNLGSGVIISSNGYLLTNYHLTKTAKNIYVSLRNGRSAKAQVVGVDPETDLAVLKIALYNLPHIWFANSNQIHVGDIVLAIGNPYGIGQTVTQGIVSAIKKNNLRHNTYEDFIQTDAAINVGNSGGALVNVYGELLGINTMIYTHDGGSEGIGFAVPANLVQFVVRSIMENGRVIRGWLGIDSQSLTQSLSEAYDIQYRKGIIITNVYNNSPAEKAGIMQGDLLVSIDGEQADDTSRIMNMVAQMPPGKEVILHILRNNQPLMIKVTLSQRPSKSS